MQFPLVLFRRLLILLSLLSQNLKKEASKGILKAQSANGLNPKLAGNLSNLIKLQLKNLLHRLTKTLSPRVKSFRKSAKLKREL